jgi:hypothetical protein
MRRVGNVASNRIYNPLNTRPPVPFDSDEADSAMERFIRQKYQDKVAASPTVRHNTGSTNSDDQPPPPPPKTGSRFGFRSASSIFPMSSKAKREAAARNEQQRPESRERSPSPPRRNKPSRVFGAALGGDTPDDIDLKLAKLRDMGFRDDKRNITVLKGLAGNLEKTIETLIRLEGGGAMKSADNSGPTSRSRTPIPPSAGISVNRTRETAPKMSDNPFDMLDLPPPPAQPQSSQSTGSYVQPQFSGNNPYQQANRGNPFGIQPSQSQYSLNQAFQNMSVSPSQPLFPHHTGGFPAPQPQFHQLHQQSMTPPVPSLPQQYYPSVIYENPSQQPLNNYNPFMQQQQQQQLQQQIRQAPPINTNFQSNPYAQQQQQTTPHSATSYQGNPFMQQQQTMSPLNFVSSPTAQQQSSYYDSGAQQQQAQNPFFQNNAQQQPGQQQMPQQVYNYGAQSPNQAVQAQAGYGQFPGGHPSQMMPQPTGMADKQSILNLYNYPQLAPTPSQQQTQQNQGQNGAVASSPPAQQQQQRSVSSPLSASVAASRNPFMSNGGAVQSPAGDAGSMAQFAPTQNMARHVSQESVDVGGWQSGRHSPDAWGQISARSVR